MCRHYLIMSDQMRKTVGGFINKKSIISNFKLADKYEFIRLSMDFYELVSFFCIVTVL